MKEKVIMNYDEDEGPRLSLRALRSPDICLKYIAPIC
jgi:hypothetical protein